MKINIVVFAVITLWLQLSSTTYASCSTAIYSFGDSLADTGNLLASIISNGSKPEFDNLPYGETYFGKPTGRLSDGRLIVDYIGVFFKTSIRKFVNILYIHEWLAYFLWFSLLICTANASGLPLLDPYLRNRTSTFKGGVNFAVAGATALDPDFFSSKNITLLGTRFSLDTQIQWFLSLRPKICASYRGRGASSSSC